MGKSTCEPQFKTKMATAIESDEEDPNILALFNDSSSDSEFEGFDLADIPTDANVQITFETVIG